MRRVALAGGLFGLVLAVPLVVVNVQADSGEALVWASALLLVVAAALAPRFAAGGGTMRPRLWFTGPAVLVAFLAATAALFAFGWGVGSADDVGSVAVGLIGMAAFLGAIAVAAALLGWLAAWLVLLDRPGSV